MCPYRMFGWLGDGGTWTRVVTFQMGDVGHEMYFFTKVRRCACVLYLHVWVHTVEGWTYLGRMVVFQIADGATRLDKTSM